MLDDIAPGYYWAIFKTDPRRKIEIIKFCDDLAETVVSMGNDTPYSLDDFEFLAPVAPYEAA